MKILLMVKIIISSYDAAVTCCISFCLPFPYVLAILSFCKARLIKGVKVCSCQV